MNRVKQLSKPEQLLSARNNSDINKIKMKTRRVKNFSGKLVGKNKRVVNNAFIPYRMRPAKTDMTKFRQELDQKDGVRELPKDKKEAEIDGIDESRYVRVGNNLFRLEDSVLDQGERLIHSRIIRREISQELNKLNQGEHKKIADVLKAAHVAEKHVIAENEKRLLSRFIGPVKTLVEVPEIKQELDEKQQIKKRLDEAKIAKEDVNFQKLVKKLEVGKLNNIELRDGFKQFLRQTLKKKERVLDPREQSKKQLQENK